MADPRDRRPEGGARPGSVTEDLASRIRRAQAEQEADHPPRSQPVAMSRANRAFRLATEFVAAIIVGGALGYGVDVLAGTRPWGMVILLLLGFGAGVINVVRSAQEMNAEMAAPPDAAATVEDEDDN